MLLLDHQRLKTITLCLIWVVVFPLLLSADPTVSFDIQIQDRSDQITKLIREKKSTQELLRELKRREWGVVEVLKVLNNNIEDTQETLYQLQANIRFLEEEVGITANKIEGLHRQIEIDKERIYQELYALFYIQKVKQHTFFLGANSLQHYFRNQKLLQNQATVDAHLVDRLNDNLNELEAEQRSHQSQKAEMQALRKTQLQQQKLLAFERQQQVTYLHHIQKNRTTRVKVLREIQVELERLNDAIHSLETKRENEKKAKRFRGLYRFKYSLPSPVKGKVVHRFGRKSSRFYTLFKRGVLVETEGNEEVKTILGGKVVFSGPFRGYHNLVILDHGKGSFSVYGNLDEVFVIVEDVIDQNYVIGNVAYDGKENRHLFYFETRYNKKAVNPEQWLKKPSWKR